MKKLIFTLALAACTPEAPEAQTDEPTEAQQVELESLQPSVTRAGHLRFTTKAIHDPRAARVFLDRLHVATESEAVRAALVEALPRTGGDYADEVLELMAKERSPLVRAAYVHTARRAPAAQAVAIAQRGLADSSPEVIAETIRATASLVDGAKLAGPMRSALSSSDATVRMEAARTIGILKIGIAKSDLDALAADASPEVRREAARAITRLDARATSTR
ncbi:MAG: HEAT repeat domain-containing protein [Kofleriaceae bacterium]